MNRSEIINGLISRLNNSSERMMNDSVNGFNVTDITNLAKVIEMSMTERPPWIRELFVVSMLTTFVVGLVGNLVTCTVIYCDRTMHTATNYYLFNLAVSDLIVAFGIILDVYSYSFNSELLCKVHFFLVVALWNNGVLIMTALAIERYIAIWYPLLLNSKPVWRRVMKIIAFIWILAILETIPEIWTLRLIKIKDVSVCFIMPSKFARLLNGILALFNFIIPLAIMLFVYTTIAFKVNVTQRSNSRDKIFNYRDNRSKVNKLIALTMSFVCCWLPFFTMRVLIFSCDMQKTPWIIKNWDFMLMLCSFNGWFSIVLNPLLFSLMSIKFRKALKMLWETKVRRKQHKQRSAIV